MGYLIYLGIFLIIQNWTFFVLQWNIGAAPYWNVNCLIVLHRGGLQYIETQETLTLMGRQPNSGAGPHTLTTHCPTSPRSRNGGTTHDETGVEAEGRSRRVEIPPQSQRRDGANVAAGVETGLCSKKTIAPRC
jgi:hypothetical protein